MVRLDPGEISKKFSFPVDVRGLLITSKDLVLILVFDYA